VQREILDDKLVLIQVLNALGCICDKPIFIIFLQMEGGEAVDGRKFTQ
jgi:hypothetical protein